MADIQNVQKLRAMYADVKETVDGLKGSIKQVEAQQGSLTQEKNAIEDAVMNELTLKMSAYLPEKALVLRPSTPVQIEFGGTYGDVTSVSGIFDWVFKEEVSTPGPLPGDPPIISWEIFYQFDGIGWDGDETIQGYVDDWRFAHDYLNQELGTGTIPSTYGINPNISALEGAKEILTNNTNKIKDSKAVFAKYIQI